MDMKVDEAERAALVMRLKRIEGQLRGIQRMIEEGEDCEGVAQQMAATRRAMDKAFYEMVGCLLEAGGRPTPAATLVRGLLARYA